MPPVRILVVDDEPDLELLVRQKFRRHIRSSEWEFEFAADGHEALQRLESGPTFDIVLTDINMPRMDGLTLLTRVASLGRNIKTVVVSAYGDMQNIRTAMNRGAFDFVTKPIDFTDLETTIRRTWEEVEAYRRALSDQRQLMALQKELDVARRIQEAVLLRDFPDRDELDMFGYMTPAREVGGDFYDFFFLEDGRLGFAIGDVAGKGISAALFMAVSRTLLQGMALQNESPAECVRAVNRLLYPQSLPHMFVTMFYGILDTNKGEVEYCCAGHNPPYVLRANGSIKQLESIGGLAVSMMPDFDYVTGYLELKQDDVLLLYTDGVTEAMSPSREEFTTERLEDILRDNRPATAADVIRHVVRAVTDFTGGYTQSDDITMLALRFRGDAKKAS